MKRLAVSIFFLVLLVIIAGAGIFAGYNAINIRENKPISIPLENAVANALNRQEEIPIQAPEVKPEEPKILANKGARMVFEYYRKELNTIDVEEEELPFYLEGKSAEEIQEAFKDWEIVEFNENRILFRRTIEEITKEIYRITSLDGYIAVFYENPTDSSKIKEITDTPLSALPKEEQERIKAGFTVTGQEALMRILEDLSS